MKLSIITINWNNAAGVRHTIESVVTQISDQCEYIVVDGESTDGSIDVINEYASKITRCIVEPNKGIYGNMNKGIRKATGEYCLFLNSGDWLNQEILSEAVAECTGEDIIYFNTILSYDELKLERLKYSSRLTMRNFYKGTIGHQSTLIKTSLFDKYGLYNENNKLHSDYEFWIKTIIVGNCTCKYVDKFLCYYDMNGRTSKPSERSLNEIENILAHNVPKRIIADYEYWFNKEQEMEALNWLKSKRYIYPFLEGTYKLAQKLSSVKKAL